MDNPKYRIVTDSAVNPFNFDMGNVRMIRGNRAVLLRAIADRTTAEFPPPPHYRAGELLLLLRPDEARKLSRLLREAADRME